MAELLDIVLDIDFESVCRLCLKKNGVMSNIYDDTASTLSERILSIAAVEILPDDGLPGLICHCCRDKVEKFIKFREQIEKSYYLLCHCIGIDFTETESNCEENLTCSPIKTNVSSIKDYISNEKPSKTKTNISLSKEGHNDNSQSTSGDVDTLQFLLKKHYLEQSDGSSDLLVNPADGFVNIDHLTYNIAEDEKVIYEKTSDENETSASNEPLSNQHINLMPIDIESITSSGINSARESEVLSNYCILKEQDPKTLGNDRIFPLSFSDGKTNHSESLQDVFHCLENEGEDSCQNGFDDITKYLKSSQNIDFNKLKEEIKYLKNKNEKNEYVTETNADYLAKKLANRGVLCVKTEDTSDNSVLESINVSNSNNFKVQQAIVAEFKNGIRSKTGPANDTLYKVGDKKVKQIFLSAGDIWESRFAEKQVESREIYTEANLQEEIVPRITEISTTFVEQKKCPNGLKKTEQELLTLTKYMCHLCLIEFEEFNLDLLKKHSESHFFWGPNRVSGKLQNNPQFTCEVCGKHMSQRHDFIVHQREHFNIRPFACNTCNRAFPSTLKLNQHSSRHTAVDANPESNPFSCTLCKKSFMKKQEFHYHMQTHSANSSLVCKVCNKTFSNPATLKMHNRRHVEGTRHCCEICGKSYFNKTELSRHVQFHSGIRQFPCHLCEKAFCSNAERRRHLLYHFKNKKFKCNECNKTFYESGHLNIHMRSHTNFRPHICEICGKGFPTNIKVMRHLKMHARCSPSPAEIRDKLLIKRQLPSTNVKALKNTVYPKYTPLTAETTIKTSKLNSSVKDFDSTQIISMESPGFSSTIDLEAFQENNDEEDSYIIIHEGGDSNGEVSIHNMPSLNGAQMLAGDNGQVFYILDDEDFAALGQVIENP